MSFKIDMSKLKYESQEFDYKEDIKLKIRPFPASEGEIVYSSRGAVIPNKTGQDKFVHCLTGWTGDVVDADDKPLLCTDEVKRAIYDFHEINQDCMDMVVFVISKINAFKNKKESEEQD
jgi:hypothetical protein